MSEPDHDPSIFNEPHLCGEAFQDDPTEEFASRTLDHRRTTEDEIVEQSVWDEPGLSVSLAGPVPQGAPTYSDWLSRKWEQTTIPQSWMITFGLALAAGPWAVLGALMGGGGGGAAAGLIGVVMLTIVGPLTEEVMKSAAVLWVIEKRPFLLRSRLQIYVAHACGAFGFAAIENLIYLFYYIKDPSAAIIFWRWTVCVALHVGCTIVSAMGLSRIWYNSMKSRTRPELSHWIPFLIAAATIHGVYNGAAVIFSIVIGL